MDTDPQSLRTNLLDVVQQLRSLIGELRPVGLEEFGLPAALQGYVAELEQQEGEGMPEVSLQVDGAFVDLPQPLAVTLFRIVQEALRNALRHADARRVTICLGQLDGKVMLRVSDNGCRFQMPPRPNAYAESGHFGLVGIAERVDQAGGELTIESSPGAGTTITASVPLNASGGSDD